MLGTIQTKYFRSASTYAHCSLSMLLACVIAGMCSGHALAGTPSAGSAAKSPRATKWLPPTTPPASHYGVAKSLEKRTTVSSIDDLNKTFGLKTTFAHVDGVAGEQVNHVELDSLAKEMKLAPGDMIVDVNGISLSNSVSSHKTMGRAVRLGGWLTLKVRLCHSGAIVYRTGSLESVGNQ